MAGMIVESRPWFLSFAEHPFKIIFAVRPDISPLGIALERLERPTSSLKHSYTSPPNRGQRGKSGAPIHRRPKSETKPPPMLLGRRCGPEPELKRAAYHRAGR